MNQQHSTFLLFHISSLNCISLMFFIFAFQQSKVLLQPYQITFWRNAPYSHIMRNSSFFTNVYLFYSVFMNRSIVSYYNTSLLFLSLYVCVCVFNRKLVLIFFSMHPFNGNWKYEWQWMVYMSFEWVFEYIS